MSIIPKVLAEGQKPHTTITGPGLTKQEFRVDADINTIVKRVIRTGIMPVLQNAQPIFADVSTMPDFAESLRRTRAGAEAFETLPAHIRHEFHNDPVELITFLSKEENRKKAEDLGLLAPKPQLPVAPAAPAAMAAPAAPVVSPAPTT